MTSDSGRKRRGVFSENGLDRDVKNTQTSKQRDVNVETSVLTRTFPLVRCLFLPPMDSH